MDPIVRVVGSVLALVLLPACADTVSPVVGSEHPFTLWGFMNSGADTQYVRIFEITDTLGFGRSNSIDAVVSSKDESTGEQVEWIYKTVRFDDGTTGHVFWAPFRAEYSHEYVLEAVRSDGERSSVRVVMPPKVDLKLDLVEHSASTPIRIEGDVFNLIGAKVTYYASNVPPLKAWPPGTPIHPPVLQAVSVPYSHALKRTDYGYRLNVDMLSDAEVVRDAYEENCLVTSEQYSAPNIWLRSMEFSLVATGPEWKVPGGGFNIDVVSAPGVLSNVINGYGFFGAGEQISIGWSPTLESRLISGYNYEVRCQEGPFDIDECRNPPVPCNELSSTM